MNTASLVRSLTVVGLFVVMLAMGLRVTPGELLASMRKPRLVVLGLLVNFLLVPAATIALLRLFDPDPMVSAGFLILAVCPGAPVGPPFASVARGDVPTAVGLMVVLAGLSAIVTPLLLGLLSSQLLPAGTLRIDSLGIVRALLVTQILPLGLGLALHHQAPAASGRLVRPVGMAANVLLLAIVAFVLAEQYPTLALIRTRGWLGMLCLLGISLGLGWLCGGPGKETRKTLALTTAARNVAVGLVIVSTNFAGSPAVTAVVAYGLVSILGTFACAGLLGAAAHRTRAISLC